MKYTFRNLHIFVIVLFLLIKAFIIIFLLDDRGWEPDSYMHLLQVRTIFYDFPNNLTLGLGVWEKPLYIYPLAIVYEIFGLEKIMWAQLINSIYFGFISYFVYKSLFLITKSKSIGISGLILCNVSLLLFISSLTALTEPVFLLCLVAGFYFAISKKFALSSILIGLCVLARIEGLLFIGVYVLWLIFELDLFTNRKINIKNLKSFLFYSFIAAVPLIAWIIAGGLAFDNFLFLIDRGYPSTSGIYGYGNLFDFPRRLLIYEIVIFGLSILSVFFSIKNYKKINSEYSLAFSWFYFFLLSQMLLWVSGKFGSAGLMRYLVSIIPFGIITGLYYLPKIKTKIDIRYFLGVIILSNVLLTTFHLLGVAPLSSKSIQFEENLRTSGEWLRDNNTNSKNIYTNRPEVVYYSEQNGNLHNKAQNYKHIFVANQPGIYVWTSDWATVLDLTFEDMENNSKLIQQFDEFIYIFEI